MHASGIDFQDFEHMKLYSWWFVNVLNSFTRFAVPLFVMISGCVLLGKKYGIKDFYIKRGTRLIPPFLFWSLIYILFDHYCWHKQQFSLIIQDFIISGKAFPHLWYLSMFILIMIIAPFINNYIVGKKPSSEDVIYLLIIITLLLTLNQSFKVLDKLFMIKMDWSLRNYHWYLGYFILGYFINIYHDKIPIGNVSSAIILGSTLIFGAFINYYLVSILGVRSVSLILDFMGVLVFIITISIFHLASRNRQIFKENYIISSIASLSFGIYLIHEIFLISFTHIKLIRIQDEIIRVPLLIFMTLIFSWITMLVLTKWKWFRSLC